MSADDLTRGRLLALADALPDGASVTLDATALRRLAGIDREEDAGTGAALVDLTADAVGAELGRSASTIRAWCASARIPGAYRLHGREWRIPRASLRRYLDTQAQGHAPKVKPEGESSVDLGRWRRSYRRRDGGKR